MDNCDRCQQPESYGCGCTTLEVSEWRSEEIERLRAALGKIALRMELNADEMQRIAAQAINVKEQP